MNRTNRLVLWVGSALLLGGCATFQVVPPGDPDQQKQQVDQWIAERQYGRALSLLAGIDPKDPIYPQSAERRRQVERLAEAYEKEVMAKAKKDATAGDWASALDAYDLALERLPESTRLKDGLAELHRQQTALLTDQRLELLITHAQWLKRSLPLYERIARTAPRDTEAQRDFASQQEAAAKTAQRLAERGVAAFEAGQHSLAERTLPVAAELSDDPAVAKAYARLKAWRNDRERERQAAREKRLKEAKAREAAARRHIEEATARYQQALQAADYTAARESLGELEKLTPDDTSLADERVRLEEAVHAEVERLFEEGVGLYSRGEFEKAAATWRRVLELEPEYRPAVENLDRAERVIERLKQLREKQADRLDSAPTKSG